jgi:hypothetical protein
MIKNIAYATRFADSATVNVKSTSMTKPKDTRIPTSVLVRKQLWCTFTNLQNFDNVFKIRSVC